MNAGIAVGYGAAAAGGLVALVSILALQIAFASTDRPQTRDEYGRWCWEVRPPAMWGSIGGLAVFLAGMGLAMAFGAR